MAVWLRYVDDTFTILKEDQIENIKMVLNAYHPKINFTHEVEADNILPFLDVKVLKNADNTFSSSVYRKQTDTNVYVHWKAHAPKIWKIGTLKGLFRRAFLVSSTDESLKIEIDYLKQVFTKINEYPKTVVENTLKCVRDKVSEEMRTTAGNDVDLNVNTVETANEGLSRSPLPTYPHIILPYKGFKGEQIIKNFKNVLSSFLPENVIPRFIFKGQKLGSFFPLKDKIDERHKSGVIYGYQIPNDNTNAYHYIGETSVRLETRIHEHTRTDKNSAIYKHAQENNYTASQSDFSVLAQGYNKWLDRKLCESLFIKDNKPILNAQKNSYNLELFP